MTTYCPWSGAVDCGCTQYPFTRNGQIPERCQDMMPLPNVGAYPNLVTPEKKEEYMKWWRKGQPRLGADDLDTGEPDYAQGG